MEYKPVATTNPSFDKKVKNTIYALILLMIVPSVYLAYSLLKEKEYNQKVENFLKNEFQDQVIIYKKINYHTTSKKVELALLSDKLDSTEINLLHKKMKIQNIENTELIIKHNTSNLKEEILSEIYQK